MELGGGRQVTRTAMPAKPQRGRHGRSKQDYLTNGSAGYGEERRAQRDADPAWADYQQRTEGLVASQENKVCRPMEWSGIK